MITRIVLFFIILALYSIAKGWLRLAGRRLRLDILGQHVLQLIAFSAFLYGLVWVWTGTFYFADLGLILAAQVLAGIGLGLVVRSLEPAAESWFIVGANILLEFYLTSWTQRAARVAVGIATYLLLGGLFFITIVILPPASTYANALSLAGLVAMFIFALGAAYSTPILLHRLLPHAARLQLVAFNVSTAGVAIAFLALGQQDWPIAHLFAVGDKFSINTLVPITLLVSVLVTALPAVLGDQLRVSLEQRIAEWQFRFSTRASTELQELAFAPLQPITTVVPRLTKTLQGRLDTEWNLILPLDLVTRQLGSTEDLPGLARGVPRLDQVRKDDLKEIAEHIPDRYKPPVGFPLRIPYLVRWAVSAARRLGRLFPQGDIWQTRVGWSQALAVLTQPIDEIKLLHRLFMLDLAWLREWVQGVKVRRLIRWPLRFFLWRVYRVTRHVRRRRLGEPRSSMVEALERIPETDVRWRHVLWLRRNRDRINSEATSISEDGGAAPRSKGLLDLSSYLANEAKQAGDAIKALRDTKRIGGRLIAPLFGSLPLLIVVVTVKLLVPYLQ